MHGRNELRIILGILVLVVFWAASLSAATAGTTGTIRGHVDDRATKAPLAGVTVSAMAPSGASTAKTDAHGDFLFISLSPDTYVLTATRSG
ncbi:MAG: carboxypeptidase-like regulatory domain-containing protein, partial [Candidatus Cybelea sp.]